MPCLSVPLSSHAPHCSTVPICGRFQLSSYGTLGARSAAHTLPLARKRLDSHTPHLSCRAAVNERLPSYASVAPALYAILGIEQNVSQAEIKSAYRQMARQYHPDVCGAADKDGSVQKFIRVQEAYEILSDPEKRAEYDYSLLHPFCAQALGRGFGTGVTMSGRRSRRNEDRHGPSDAWKLQWKAQLSNLGRRRRSDSCANESWGASMRRKDVS